MARTSTIDVPDELREFFDKSVERRDRFVLGVCQGHKHDLSRARRRAIRERSLFGFLAPIWQSLTNEQKDAWRSAGVPSGLTNWQLFISDNAARVRHDLTLAEPPSDLWQVRAGMIEIDAPADELTLRQMHPLSYWVTRRVQGAPWRQELVKIEEPLSLPIELEISYRADLVAEGAEQSARYFARVWTSYQGQDIETDFSIDFANDDQWHRAQLTTGTPIGYIVGYALYLEVKGYRGRLLFDNVRAIHSGQNWARDPRCDNISREFKKAFAIVPPFWVPETLQEGASFSSVYPPSF